MVRTVAALPVRGLWALSTVLILASVAGFWLFSRGFLLTRMVLPQHSLPSTLPFTNSSVDEHANEWYPAKFERAIILVVDAMRIDFATWSDELNTTFSASSPPPSGHRLMPYHNRLPIINTLNTEHPEKTMLYRFRADPPTTTLQRLKGLTTGQLPTFIDAGSNFAGSAIDEDNWLQALRRPSTGPNGKRPRNLVFLGDDTWSSLFPHELSDTQAMEQNDTLWNEGSRGWARVRPFPSLNVWDLDTVDDGVFSRLPFFLLPSESAERDMAPQAAADVRAKRSRWRQLVRQQEMLLHPDFGVSSQSNASNSGMVSAAVGLEQLHNDWDVIIAHGLGVDHCGHRYGPDHPAISSKLAQTNQAIELIIDAVDRSDKATALYVFGDHGMDPKGDHGGDSPREVDAALWIYSNKAWNTKEGKERSSRVLEHASALVKNEPLGAALDDDLKSGWWLNTHLSDDYRKLLEPSELRSIPQIDLVSSLSLTLGLPIPFNNLGAVIPEMFASDTGVGGEWGLLRALRLNAAQTMRYLDTYVESSRSHGFSDDALSAWKLLYQRAEASYQELTALVANNPKARQQSHVMLVEERVAAEYYAFMRVVLGTLRQMWAQFDPALIIAGLAVLILTTVALVAVYVRSRHISLETMVARMWKQCATGGFIGVVIGRALSIVLVSQSISHISLFEASAAGLAIGVMATSCTLLFVATSDDELSISRPGSLCTRLCSPAALLNTTACVMAIMHGLAFMSNSFTFNEDGIVLYLAQTLTLALVGTALYSLMPSSPSKQKAAGLRALLCTSLILVLNRIASYSTVCREEQLPGCTPTFYGLPSASISGVPLAVANLAMVWLVPFVVLRVLKRSQSHRAMIAKLWISIGMRISMGMSAVYWLLDSIDGNYSSSAMTPGKKSDWSDLRIVLARMAVGIALGGGLAAWYSSPFCLDVVVSSPPSQPTGPVTRSSAKTQASMPQHTAVVLGYGNAFGAAYLVFVTVVFCVLYLVQQPMGGIMISLLFIKLLLCIETFDSLRDALAAPSLLPAQTSMMAILAYLDYFSTGHQFTLVSIQWSTAFIGIREMQLVICGVIVALNTLGSFILASACVPMAVLWNESLGSRVLKLAPESFVARLAGAATLYAGYHAVVATSSAVNAAVFRRHLMVWKIFAPRFMFAVPVFLVSITVVLLVATGFAAMRVLRLGINVGNVRGLPVAKDSGRV
ncbi:mannose-ethanolamine phosphotransferase gpi13 [Coemansia pectinata]|uniref:Mannose-ethanolamine phosphotransferase gpi13 n=1 Tax=Coemansia pectinata TaxID=1052879 RepID=A0A9W8H0H7_9FUNG|nr:mannose-ethanolamine phosphotransferase gpi13 [Coemansia pectinata]